MVIIKVSDVNILNGLSVEYIMLLIGYYYTL